VLDPADLDVPIARMTDLQGGDAAFNAEVARRVLAGERGPARDIVALNAAAALTVAGLADDLSDGLQHAADSIDSGKASAKLGEWVEVSNRD
jgi:anthranilate phosphoribosyltransferase